MESFRCSPNRIAFLLSQLGKTFAQVAAFEMVLHDLPDDQPEMALRFGEPLFVMLLEDMVILVERFQRGDCCSLRE